MVVLFRIFSIRPKPDPPTSILILNRKKLLWTAPQSKVNDCLWFSKEPINHIRKCHSAKIEWKTISGDVYTWPKMSKTKKKATAACRWPWSRPAHSVTGTVLAGHGTTEVQSHQPRRFFLLPQLQDALSLIVCQFSQDKQKMSPAPIWQNSKHVHIHIQTQQTDWQTHTHPVTDRHRHTDTHTHTHNTKRHKGRKPYTHPPPPKKRKIRKRIWLYIKQKAYMLQRNHRGGETKTKKHDLKNAKK